MLKHRALVAVSVLGLVGPTLLVSATGAAGVVVAAADTTCKVFFDINNPRDLHDDVAVGTPNEDVQKHANAGTVTIAYGDASGTLGQLGGKSLSMADFGFSLGTGDRFGAAVLTADLNGDGCGDLVVGVPGRNHGAGVVVIVYGQPKGTPNFGSNVQILKQGSNGTGGKSEAGDGFGSALAVAGRDANGNPTRLWVGVPGEDIGSAKDAGMAHVYSTSAGHFLPTSGVTSRHQGKDGIGSKPEAGDRFGAALAGSATTVLVGVPGEDVGTIKGAGMFHAIVRGHASSYNGESAGIPVTSETGDGLGSTVAIMGSCMPGKEAWAIGAPRENVGAVADAGQLLLMDRGTGTALALQQGGSALGGTASSDDQFGAALNATGTTNRASSFLAVGIPHEDVGSVKNSGRVTTFSTTCPGGALSTTSVTDWTQGSGGVPGTPATNNLFGTSLGAVLVLEGVPATGTLHYRLLIGAPGQDEPTDSGPLVNSGMVTVLPDAAGGFTATGSSLFGQNTGEMPGLGETDDGFGSVLDSANSGR